MSKCTRKEREREVERGFQSAVQVQVAVHEGDTEEEACDNGNLGNVRLHTKKEPPTELV